MSDTTNNAESAAAVPEVKVLKSTDTSTVKKVLDAAEAAKAEPAPKPEPAQAKPQDAAPTDAAPGESEVDGHDSDAPSADAPKRKKDRLPRWVQERMERVRLKTEAETRDRILHELQAQIPAMQPQEAARHERELTVEDFDFDQGAFTDYKVQQGIQKYEQTQKQRETERKQAETVETQKARIDAFEDRVGAGAWQDILEAPINTDPSLAPLTELFLGDDHDLDMAWHFAQNPEEAKRIGALPKLKQMRELAKLAERFEAEPETKAPELPKKLTNAPPPPKTVSGAGKPSVDINSPDLTTAQRIALWKKRG